MYRDPFRIFKPSYWLSLFVGFLLAIGLWYVRYGTFNLASQNIQTALPSTNETAPPLPSISVIHVPRADLLEEAWKVRRAWEVPTSTRVLIAPHHLIAAKEIASLFSSLPFQPSTVFVLSPDHFNQGRTPFTTTRSSFVSSQATSSVDIPAVTRLLKNLPRAEERASVFPREHGVHALLPFMHKAWPSARVVPLLIKDETHRSDLEALAAHLVGELNNDPYALVVASMDFSHYLPAELADFHDELTMGVVKALEVDGVDKLETDVSGPLTTGLLVARSLALGDVRIHAHTNSLRIAKAKHSQDSTSHLLVSFSKGAIPSPSSNCASTVPSTFLVFGPLDFGVTDPFLYLRGQENRIILGQSSLGFMNDFWTNSGTFQYTNGPKTVFETAQFTAWLSFISNIHGTPYLQLRSRQDQEPHLEIHHSKDPHALQLAVGLVAECRQDGSSKNHVYLYPLRASQNGSALILGPARQTALEAIAQRSSLELRSQIRRGVVEW